MRRDRNRNGGVLLYISVDLNFSVLPGYEGLEILSVVVEKDLCKFIFLFVLRFSVPHYSNFILGDFNVNFCNYLCVP